MRNEALMFAYYKRHLNDKMWQMVGKRVCLMTESTLSILSKITNMCVHA